MSDPLLSVADAMFASAASVLGTLAGRTVAAGAAARTQSDASIRIEPDVVATLTRVPSGDLSFVTQYVKQDLARVVELMLGTPGDGGELDAMQLSIVAETVAQVSSAMGEALTTETGRASNGIESAVAAGAADFPAPPFATFSAPLDQIVAFVSCELKIGDMSGVMNFCLPYLVLQSIGPQLSDFQWSPTVIAGRGMTDEDIAQLARNVERAPVDVQVELGRTTLSLRDLIALQTGDLLLFDKPVGEPLVATVNDREKFKVFPGVNRERLAVRVAEIVESEE